MLRRKILKMSLDKLQWLQDQNEINGDNLNNVRHEVSSHFGNNLWECQKEKN
jgi:hypothetical protein